MKDKDVLSLGFYCTAKRSAGKQCLLFVQSSESEPGPRIPAQEIYLNDEQIEKLYAWWKGLE